MTEEKNGVSLVCLSNEFGFPILTKLYDKHIDNMLSLRIGLFIGVYEKRNKQKEHLINNLYGNIMINIITHKHPQNMAIKKC